MTSAEFTEWVEARRMNEEPKAVSYYAACNRPVAMTDQLRTNPRLKVSENIRHSTSQFVANRVSNQAIAAAIDDFAERLLDAISAKDVSMASELATEDNLLFQTASPCWDR